MLYTKELADKLRKDLENIEIKADGADVFNMIISVEKADRDGETILLAGGDLKNYKKNPVVLLNHRYAVESIVGKTTKLTVDGKNMIAQFIFADTELGQLAKKLYVGGFLKTASIGFIVFERDPNDRSIITKWELLEWSLVAVPANAAALSLDGKQIEKELFAKAVEIGLIVVKDEEGTPTPAEETPAAG